MVFLVELFGSLKALRTETAALKAQNREISARLSALEEGLASGKDTHSSEENLPAVLAELRAENAALKAENQHLLERLEELENTRLQPLPVPEMEAKPAFILEPPPVQAPVETPQKEPVAAVESSTEPEPVTPVTPPTEPPGMQPGTTPVAPGGIIRWLPGALAGFFCFFLAIIPPILVFEERWLYMTMRDSMRNLWCKWNFLCRTWLPSYFLAVIPMFVVLIVLFVIFAKSRREAFGSSLRFETAPTTTTILDPRQRRTGRILQIISLAGAVLLFVLGFVWKHVPGAELVPVILMYLAGRFLVEFPLPQVWAALKKVPAWVLPFGLAQIAVILFMRSVTTDPRWLWGYAVLLILAFIYLLRYRRQASPVVWLMLLALLLFCIQVNSWQFSVIGDEYSFFTYARDILQSHGFDGIVRNFFNGSAVYGSHPYFSSILQALSMALLGKDSFGWRFSSIYMAAASVAMLYLFLRVFLSKPSALLAAGFLAVSQYLMAFSKIGYNNLQALFVMTLALWLAAEAIRQRTPLLFTLLGLAVGACFYVYPGALYAAPLPFLLLLFYHPPTNRTARHNWLLTIAAFSLVFMPLIFQPHYWQEKLPGTVLNSAGGVAQQGYGFHFASNFIYTLFSYLYVPDETHFIVASYVDPLTAMLVPVGLAWIFKLLHREKFAGFLLASFTFMAVVVGTTHDRQTPAATRMFLLLPWLVTFAALGLSWLGRALKSWGGSRPLRVVLAATLLVAMLAANLYQAYGLSRVRTRGTPNLEVLFLRFLQYASSAEHATNMHYIFITQPDWGIDGIRVMRDVYDQPASQTQLERYAMLSPSDLPEYAVQRILEEDTFVIVQPWMEEGLRQNVEHRLAELGKLPCPIQDVPQSEARFTLWFSSKWAWICPMNGVWE